MVNCTRLLAGAASLALAASLGVVPSFAQSAAPQAAAADTGIGEIIVTAQKREERLQDVPIAITALGTASLAKANVASLTDFNKLSVPGLVTTAFVGTPTLAINIRGISTQDPAVATIEAPTAVYIDGVYIPRSVGLGSEIIEIERVEVLRGPQGTLFGRNAEGGAVSVVSKKPSGKLEGSIGGDIGSYGKKKAYAHLNLPAFANISTKFDAYISKLDGYTRNGPNDTVSRTLAGAQNFPNFGAADNWGVRGQALWQPSSDVSVLIAADYSELKNASLYLHWDRNGGPIQQKEVGTYVKETPFAWYNPYTFDTVKGVQGTITYNVSDNVTVKSITSLRDLQSDGNNNLVSYITFPSFFPGDAGSKLSGLLTKYSVRSKSFSQEVQLLGNTSTLQYVVGAFYFRESADDGRANYITLKVPAVGTPFSIPPVSLGGDSLQSVRSSTFAMFAQATWSPEAFGGKLKITPGLRYTETTKSGIRTKGKFGLAPGDIIAPGSPLIRQIPSLSRVDPALTVAYDITPDVNVYVRYAQAFRDGGVTVRSETFSTFGPEVNKQVEFGLKSELFDRRVRFNLAAFHSWVEGQQISIAPLTDATKQEIINVPDTARLWGLEGELTVAPVTGLTIGTNFAIMDGNQPPYDCSGCDRRAIVFLPKYSLGVNVDYTTPVAGTMNAFFHLDYKYQSAFHTSPKAFVGEIWAPSRYNVINARVGLEKVALGPVEASLSVYGENLANNKDIIFDTNQPFQTIQLPRRFGVAASVNF